MAHISSAFPAVHVPQFGSFGRLAGLIAAIRTRAAERTELAKFDRRDLHDIGMTEADRAAFLSKSIWHA